MTERRAIRAWLPPLAGLALGAAVPLLLPGARERLAPLLLVPLVALAWLGIGTGIAGLVRSGAALLTRTALGASLHFLGRFLGRRTLGIEVLGWSAALPVLISPRLGLHVGFQLFVLPVLKLEFSDGGKRL